MFVSNTSKNPKRPNTSLPYGLSAQGSSENPLADYHLGPKSHDGRYVDDDQNDNKNFMPKIVAFSIVIIFLLAGVAAYLWFFRSNSYIDPTKETSSKNAKTETKSNSNNPVDGNKIYNPLNGIELTEEQYNTIKDRKPIAVMVNNYVAARPSSGVSQADVVFEVVAEGGITRLMPIFYSKIPPSVGSIRSARYYFAQFAQGYHPHYVHWGAAHQPPCALLDSKDKGYCAPVNGVVETDPRADAYDQIVKLGLPNLDGGNYSCDQESCAFGRDPKKLGKMPLEHTAFTRLPLIYDLAKKIRPEEAWHKNVPVKEWVFKDDAVLGDRGNIGLNVPITYNYWDTMAGFNVSWQYDKENNEYIRSQGGVKQIDNDNQKELRAKVIIVRFTKEEAANDKKHHMFYDILGKGDALIFQDGKVTKGSWVHNNFDDRDIYIDESGKQIPLDRGQVWIQVLRIGNTVKYDNQSVSPTPTVVKK